MYIHILKTLIVKLIHGDYIKHLLNEQKIRVSVALKWIVKEMYVLRIVPICINRKKAKKIEL